MKRHCQSLFRHHQSCNTEVLLSVVQAIQPELQVVVVLEHFSMLEELEQH
jgi:hypothetical protein